MQPCGLPAWSKGVLEPLSESAGHGPVGSTPVALVGLTADAVSRDPIPCRMTGTWGYNPVKDDRSDLTRCRRVSEPTCHEPVGS
jgi:hypothetical protein